MRIVFYLLENTIKKVLAWAEGLEPIILQFWRLLFYIKLNPHVVSSAAARRTNPIAIFNFLSCRFVTQKYCNRLRQDHIFKFLLNRWVLLSQSQKSLFCIVEKDTLYIRRTVELCLAHIHCVVAPALPRGGCKENADFYFIKPVLNFTADCDPPPRYLPLVKFNK